MINAINNYRKNTFLAPSKLLIEGNENFTSFIFFFLFSIPLWRAWKDIKHENLHLQLFLLFFPFFLLFSTKRRIKRFFIHLPKSKFFTLGFSFFTHSFTSIQCERENVEIPLSLDCLPENVWTKRTEIFPREKKSIFIALSEKILLSHLSFRGKFKQRGSMWE